MFVYERRYQIGLMRAVGATKSLIRRLILMEAMIVGLASGLAGLGLTWGLVALLRWALEKSQRLPFDASKLFAFPLWLPLAALGFAILFCLLGAFFPARRAAALDPARVLNES
jgi:ABC-type antimicrobial peptide transport system permease subunit